jgi:two-component system LytT family response regulator
MLKATIIDDEPDNVKLLALQLKMYCPNVEVVSTCTQSREGLLQIKDLNPDIVFLDIEMPFMNGFELLEAVGKPDFMVIFVTAYDQFAVKAFRFSALDYLLKPIDARELQAAVAKAENKPKTDERQLQMLKHQFHTGDRQFPDKIALPYQNGVIFTELSKVIYCEADNNYTRIILQGGAVYIIAKTLRSIQEILEGRNFLRVHRQYMINLDHITKYVKGEGNYLIMSDGKSIPVARKQKEKLVGRFGWL